MTTAVASPSVIAQTPGSVQSDVSRGDPIYDQFYACGGWKYSFWKEYWWHRRHLVKRFRLCRGTRLLEVACGNGFHTNLLRRMGFASIGVDRSAAGIAWARAHFPRTRYHCGDLFGELPVEPASCDAVYARGCSHYHYDLMTDQALRTTRHLFHYLRSGGVFIMAIVTNLSGSKEPDKIWHNTLDDYRRHFSSFDTEWSVDWVAGMAVCGLRKPA